MRKDFFFYPVKCKYIRLGHGKNEIRIFYLCGEKFCEGACSMRLRSAKLILISLLLYIPQILTPIYT